MVDIAEGEVTRLDSVNTALIWLAGVRALSGIPDAGNMRSMKWALIEDGFAMRLTIGTAFGTATCIAMLPERMTEKQARNGEWFGAWSEDDTPLRRMPPAGRA